MHASINERCSCGATFAYSGTASFAAVKDWRVNHRHDMPTPTPSADGVAGRSET